MGKSTGKGAPVLRNGSEGYFEEGERVVPDPLEKGRYYTAKVNVRESSIDHMASRGRIDAAQKEAGDRFRKLWELAAVGRSHGIDPAKEFVDGGGFTDPISDDLVRAGMELSRVLRSLGPAGSQLMIALVGEGKRVEDVASNWSKGGGVVTGRRAEGYVTGRVVEALDDLVALWGLEGKWRPQNHKTGYRRNGEWVPVTDDIRASNEGHSGPARQFTVGRFGDVVEEDIRGVDRGPMTPHVAGNR